MGIVKLAEKIGERLVGRVGHSVRCARGLWIWGGGWLGDGRDVLDGQYL